MKPSHAPAQAATQAGPGGGAMAGQRAASPQLPRLLVCYLCSRQFGTKSLGIHVVQCYDRRMAEWEGAAPKDPDTVDHRGAAPKDPVAAGVLCVAGDGAGHVLSPAVPVSHYGPPAPPAGEGSSPLQKWNDLQLELHAATLSKCPKCRRTFTFDAFGSHARSCLRGLNTAAVKALMQSQAEAEAEARERRAQQDPLEGLSRQEADERYIRRQAEYARQARLALEAQQQGDAMCIGGRHPPADTAEAIATLPDGSPTRHHEEDDMVRIASPDGHSQHTATHSPEPEMPAGTPPSRCSPVAAGHPQNAVRRISRDDGSPQGRVCPVCATVEHDFAMTVCSDCGFRLPQHTPKPSASAPISRFSGASPGTSDLVLFEADTSHALLQMYTHQAEAVVVASHATTATSSTESSLGSDIQLLAPTQAGLEFDAACRPASNGSLCRRPASGGSAGGGGGGGGGGGASDAGCLQACQPGGQQPRSSPSPPPAGGVLQCTSCHTGCDARAKFCRECGTRLEHAFERTAAAAAPPSPGGGSTDGSDGDASPSPTPSCQERGLPSPCGGGGGSACTSGGVAEDGGVQADEGWCGGGGGGGGGRAVGTPQFDALCAASAASDCDEVQLPHLSGTVRSAGTAGSAASPLGGTTSSRRGYRSGSPPAGAQMHCSNPAAPTADPPAGVAVAVCPDGGACTSDDAVRLSACVQECLVPAAGGCAAAAAGSGSSSSSGGGAPPLPEEAGGPAGAAPAPSPTPGGWVVSPAPAASRRPGTSPAAPGVGVGVVGVSDAQQHHQQQQQPRCAVCGETQPKAGARFCCSCGVELAVAAAKVEAEAAELAAAAAEVPQQQQQQQGDVPEGGASAQGGGDPSEAGEAPPASVPRVECEWCGRLFAEDRVEKHTAVCKKQAFKKREVFDIAKQRRAADDQAPPRPSGGAQADAAKKKSTWRMQTNALRAALQAARQAEGKGGTALPPPTYTTEEHDGRVPCPHCGRRFGAPVAERHIPVCANMKSRPRPRPAGKKAVGLQDPVGANEEEQELQDMVVARRREADEAMAAARARMRRAAKERDAPWRPDGAGPPNKSAAYIDRWRRKAEATATELRCASCGYKAVNAQSLDAHSRTCRAGAVRTSTSSASSLEARVAALESALGGNGVAGGGGGGQAGMAVQSEAQNLSTTMDIREALQQANMRVAELQAQLAQKAGGAEQQQQPQQQGIPPPATQQKAGGAEQQQQQQQQQVIPPPATQPSKQTPQQSGAPAPRVGGESPVLCPVGVPKAQPVGKVHASAAKEREARVSCPYCSRRFAPAVASRHIPNCAKVAHLPGQAQAPSTPSGQQQPPPPPPG